LSSPREPVLDLVVDDEGDDLDDPVPRRPQRPRVAFVLDAAIPRRSGELTVATLGPFDAVFVAPPLKPERLPARARLGRVEIPEGPRKEFPKGPGGKEFPKGPRRERIPEGPPEGRNSLRGDSINSPDRRCISAPASFLPLLPA